jgi:hypothetical protein
MVMASRRTYADAVSWIKSTGEAARRGGFAMKAFGGFFCAGVVGFGVAALASPEDFGQPGGHVLRLGWPSMVLVGIVVVATGVLLGYRRHIAAIASRNLRRPYSRGPDESRAYEGALNALASCPRPLQLRFAAGWIWGPALGACVGAVLAISAAYFAVYSVLARFDVGAETAILAGADVVLGLLIFAMAARRLATWQLASSVYRAVATGYID